MFHSTCIKSIIFNILSSVDAVYKNPNKIKTFESVNVSNGLE